MPPARRRAEHDRRLGIGLSVGLHLLLLFVLLTTDAVRLPDLASLLEDPVAGGGRESVVYLPIDGFPRPGGSAAPAPVEELSAPVFRAPASARRIPAAAAPAGSTGGFVDGGPGARPVDAGGANAGGGETGVARFNRTVDLLRPRGLDPRLQPGSIDALRTDHERAALRAYARIRALNDSILAEMAAGERALDWTWTDEQGRRWGISPGKLHLGGIEIPLPVSTAPSREQRDLMREWTEIQAQAEQGAIDETFDDRVDAIRARRDAERSGED